MCTSEESNFVFLIQSNNMRVFAGLFIIGVFFIWLIYRVLIKRDLRQHKNTLGLFLLFVIAWGVLYGLALLR